MTQAKSSSAPEASDCTIDPSTNWVSSVQLGLLAESNYQSHRSLREESGILSSMLICAGIGNYAVVASRTGMFKGMCNSLSPTSMPKVNLFFFKEDPFL